MPPAGPASLDDEPIVPEHPPDDAHFGLRLDEPEDEAEPIEDRAAGLLFDDDAGEEALDGLVMETPPERLAGGDDEPEVFEPGLRSEPAVRAAAPSAPAAGYDAPSAPAYRGSLLSSDEESRFSPAEPTRSSMLPKAIMLMIGLLVGFFAGYTVGTRNLPTTPAATDAQAPAGAQTDEGTPAAAAKPGEAGQAYSEQTVAPPPSVPAEPPPAPAEPAPAATSGTLIVRSTPSRAAVTVNGTWRGRTPLTLDALAFGTHAIRVVQEGYAVAQEQVRLSAETPTRTLSLRLEREAARPAPPPARTTPPAQPAPAPRNYTGSIYVDSRPRGAKVFLDGREMGTTPLSIPEVRIGSHVVRLELADHRTWTSSTRVSAGEERRVTGSLEQIR
jgi:hypothetical protein